MCRDDLLGGLVPPCSQGFVFRSLKGLPGYALTCPWETDMGKGARKEILAVAVLQPLLLLGIVLREHRTLSVLQQHTLGCRAEGALKDMKALGVIFLMPSFSVS